MVVGRWNVVLASSGKRKKELGYGEAVWDVVVGSGRSDNDMTGSWLEETSS
jgi:hypothetical protein